MLVTLLSGALACAPAATDADSGATADTADTAAATGPGTLALSFRLDEDYVAAMAEPAVGTFRGSIFAEDDASSTGPVDGAEALQDLEVADVDLTAGGGPTGVLVVTSPLEPQVVWILGCLDTEGDDCGDPGDPITVPNENKVAVVAATETSVEVFFGMLMP